MGGSDIRFLLRMPAELAAVISARARAEDTSLNKLICGILNDEITRQVKAQDVPKARTDRENPAITRGTKPAQSEHVDSAPMGETVARGKVTYRDLPPELVQKLLEDIVEMKKSEPRCKHGYLACVMCGFNVPKQGKR